MIATPDLPRLAAVAFDKGAGLDDRIGALVARLGGGGLRVVGAVQREESLADGCCGPTLLVDFAGTATVISQDLGREAKGCRLDPQGLAEVAGRLERQLADGCDLVVLNRFGKAEAEGAGLRGVLERAVAEDVPVLLCVRSDFLPAFESFHSGLAVMLPADEDAILDWVDGVCRTTDGVVPVSGQVDH